MSSPVCLIVYVTVGLQPNNRKKKTPSNIMAKASLTHLYFSKHQPSELIIQWQCWNVSDHAAMTARSNQIFVLPSDALTNQVLFDGGIERHIASRKNFTKFTSMPRIRKILGSLPQDRPVSDILLFSDIFAHRKSSSEETTQSCNVFTNELLLQPIDNAATDGENRQLFS